MNLSRALEIAMQTHPGSVRPHNEDSIASNAAHGVAILADGMGGANAGEVASGIAVTLLLQGLKDVAARKPNSVPELSAAVIEEIRKTNTAIDQTAQPQPQCAGMGTPLVVAVFFDNRVVAAHVGDSRLYRLRDGNLTQVTRDHSLLQDQIDSGMITPEEAKRSHQKNLVTKALGIDPEVEPEVHDYDTLPGDVYLICSDGLSDMVENDDIGLTLNTLSANLTLSAQQLVDMANDNGGRDNISVILVRTLTAFPARLGWFKRVLQWFGG
ncbi:MAG: Stp1/IreP family PP2C-type Ser/Thr phosphatase [Burkholderiales bacterium]